LSIGAGDGSPFAALRSLGPALMAEWLGRFACFAVLSVRWVPLVGSGSLPIMAAINYAIYRRAFQSAWRSQEAQAAKPVGGSHAAVAPRS